MTALGKRARSARRTLRETLGYEPSQGEIATALGWSQSKFSKMELGQQERLSVDDIHALATQLRVDEYWLFTGRNPAPVSDLAMQVDRLELDHWGESAVLETARREAKRYAEQQAAARQASGLFTRSVDAMMRAGLSREIAEAAASEALRPLPDTESSPASGQGEDLRTPWRAQA